MKSIAIVGFASTYQDAPFEDAAWEIWGVNELHKYLPRWDRWFELHAREVFASEGNRNQEQHVAWLQAQPAGKPIYMQRVYDDIPASVAYPLDAMIARFCPERPYFTSSIGYMLALAIAEGRDERFQPMPGETPVGRIGIWGVDLAADSEYGEQRPQTEYLIGLARGLGIEVIVAEQSALLRADHLYGYEQRAKSEGPVSGAFLDARIAELRKKHDQAIAVLNTLDGAIEEAIFHRRIINHARRGGQVGT